VADGVEVNPAWGPKAILGDGKVTAVEFVKCKSVFDAEGRFSPVFDEKKTMTVEADTVITAIGQSPDLDFLSKSIETERGTVVVNPYTQKTNVSGIYAGGDAVLGTASLIEAIHAGRNAAKSIIQGTKG
jgi:NADPH-dependent glutamate synthase beta subunit-like oxidoreductase